MLLAARGSRKVVNQIQCATEKDGRPANQSQAIGIESLRRRGSEVMPSSRTSSNRRFLVRRQLPACSRAEENLDSPQHDDDGRYQRGRRQYTFYGSDSHTTLRFPAPLAV